MVIKLVQKINQKAEKVTQSPQKSRVDNTSACDSEGQILKNLKERTRETLQFQSSPNNLRPATKKTKKRIPTFTSQTSTSYQVRQLKTQTFTSSTLILLPKHQSNSSKKPKTA
mmetsp:Transcript_22685/g.25569  ORF Transcript_22685/g.25569 Transcript_22685/m.25569 type:complete len:113 (-) Transcript_22685:1385-1723(-)